MSFISFYSTEQSSPSSLSTSSNKDKSDSGPSTASGSSGRHHRHAHRHRRGGETSSGTCDRDCHETSTGRHAGHHRHGHKHHVHKHGHQHALLHPSHSSHRKVQKPVSGPAGRSPASTAAMLQQASTFQPSDFQTSTPSGKMTGFISSLHIAPEGNSNSCLSSKEQRERLEHHLAAISLKQR